MAEHLNHKTTQPAFTQTIPNDYPDSYSLYASFSIAVAAHEPKQSLPIACIPATSGIQYVCIYIYVCNPFETLRVNNPLLI